MSALFYFQATLKQLFKNFIKLHWHWVSSSWNMNGGGGQKKLSSKSPTSLGLKLHDNYKPIIFATTLQKYL